MREAFFNKVQHFRLLGMLFPVLDLYRYFLPHIILPEDDKVIFDIVQSADTGFDRIRISRYLAMRILGVLLWKETKDGKIAGKFNITPALWVSAEVSEAIEETADVLLTDTV